MHERIVRSINRFEASLDQDHEVGARLVNFGANVTFHIEDVGYWGGVGNSKGHVHGMPRYQTLPDRLTTPGFVRSLSADATPSRRFSRG